VLEEDYYLANFRSLIDFVGKTYQGLLSDAELRWLRAIEGAPEPAQRLYVRLSSRRSNVFRLSKLKYPEIKSIDAAAQALHTEGLCSTTAPEELSELLPAFTKPELINLLSSHDLRQYSRADITSILLDIDSKDDVNVLQCSDRWITIKGLDEYTVFKLCFFGNCYQDMSEFVLSDLGVFNYEQYRIDKQSRVFQTREQLEAHLQYFACATLVSEVDQSDVGALLEVDQSLPKKNKNDPHLTRRVDRLRNTIARQLERLDEPEQALLLYRQSHKPPSRERQVRLLMKLSRFDDALKICKDIQSAPQADEELQFVDTIRPKLYKQLCMPVTRQRRFRPETTKLNLTPGDARVELIACEFYGQFGDCFYVENTLINGVLGLFIWDIIFAPVSGAFYNPFQSIPADFYQKEFGQKRAALIKDRFTELDDPLRFSARVWEFYESRYGIMNRLVNWQYLSKELLSLALIRIPVADWRILFDRLLKDLRNHTSGLPDLILFPKQGSYELLEIKGPGDAVQKNQRRWMQYFSEHRIPYRVVHIRWAIESTPA